MSAVTESTKTQAWGDINELIQGSSTPKATDSQETDRLANKEVFMQLLVAQLKNQNPLSPADGVEFISQLAQFTQLEQSLGMRQELQTIRETIVDANTPAGDTEQP